MFVFYFFSSICNLVFGILYFFSPWFFVKAVTIVLSGLFSTLVVMERVLEFIRYCTQFGIYFFNSFVTTTLSSFVYYFGIIPPSKFIKAGEKGHKVRSILYEIFEFHTGNPTNLEMVVPNNEIHLAYFYKVIVFISVLVCWFFLCLFLVACFTWIYVLVFGAYFFWILISNIYTFFFSGLVTYGVKSIDFSSISSFPYFKYFVLFFYLSILLALPPLFYFNKFINIRDGPSAHVPRPSFPRFAFIYYKFFIYYVIELANIAIIWPIGKLLVAFSVRLALRINIDDRLNRSLVLYFRNFKFPYFKKFNIHSHARGDNNGSKLDSKLKEKVMKAKGYYLFCSIIYLGNRNLIWNVFSDLNFQMAM